MKVILLQDLKGTGKKGQVVNVADGHARNMLLPRGIALEATNAAMTMLKSKNDAVEHRKERALESAQKLAAKLATLDIKMKAKAGANGKLFGSVTSKDIAEVIKKLYKIELDKRWISTHEGIKTTGTHDVPVWLHPEVTATIKVLVEEE